MASKFVRPALLVPALLLAACGGGGGGGDSSSSGGGGASATLVVTSTNAKPVAADGLDASSSAGGASIGASLVTGVQVDTGAAPSVKLSSVALALAAKAAGRPALATGVVINPTTEPCSNGGTITISGNVSGGSSLVAGDTVNVTASNCTEVIDFATTTLDGATTITVTAGNFNPEATTFPQQITMNVAARNLSVASNGVTNVSDGEVKIELRQLSATASTSTLSGAALSNTSTRGGSTHATALRNFQVVQESVGSQVRSTVSATVVTNNPRLGSNVVYQLSTPTPLVTDLALVLSGSIKVTGSNSSLLLSVTSIDNFSLQVDSNGDGSIDATSTATTAELRGLL